MPNARNYQAELDAVLAGIDPASPPRLLLHGCCAPCSSYVLEYLSQYFAITLFYYNPNISTREEYDHRAAEVKRLIETLPAHHPITLIDGGWDADIFYTAVRGLEKEPEGGARCRVCFALRLEEAARIAAAGGYDYYTTTLSISPLKNAAVLNEIGEEMGKKHGIKHLPSDFKKRGGYQRSVALSREYDLYRQDFCGCVFSRTARHPNETDIRKETL